MRIWFFVAASLAAVFLTLAGCDRPSTNKPETTADDEVDSDPVGRWAVVPVPGGPTRQGDAASYFAWRIDTVTGSLEMCTFDPGGWKLASPPATPGAVAPPSLGCTTPATASSD